MSQALILMVFGLASLSTITYDRDAWGDWPYLERRGDCPWDLRMMLIADSARQSGGTVELEDCRIVTADIIDAYTGEIMMDVPGEHVEIDHLVPLRHAHNHGAAGWTDDQRRRYYTWTYNLRVVHRSTNRSKGSKPPWEWSPDVNRCDYVRTWASVKTMHGLAVPLREAKWIGATLRNCARRAK